MAIRWDHGFGIDYDPSNPISFGYTAESRQGLLTSMMQIHEEVVGQGFYQPKKEEAYARVGVQGGSLWHTS